MVGVHVMRERLNVTGRDRPDRDVAEPVSEVACPRGLVGLPRPCLHLARTHSRPRREHLRQCGAARGRRGQPARGDLSLAFRLPRLGVVPVHEGAVRDDHAVVLDLHPVPALTGLQDHHASFASTARTRPRTRPRSAPPLARGSPAGPARVDGRDRELPFSLCQRHEGPPCHAFDSRRSGCPATAPEPQTRLRGRWHVGRWLRPDRGSVASTSEVYFSALIRPVFGPMMVSCRRFRSPR